MKLLGWMHRKFRQNSSEPLKDFALGHACNCLIGQPPLDDQQQYYTKQNYGNNSNKQFKQAQKEHLRNSFAGLEAARVEEEEEEGDYYEEESSTASSMNELFHGFLAIGTLGSTDPATPTFAISVDNITEKETEVTENELKYINDELEKVLGAEARDDSCNDSSGRNSYVSTGRSSHGSTITLSGKPIIEGQETNLNGTATCPLQGYLFGSAIELSETTTTVAKKEHRTSLGELFQKTKLTEENFGSNEKRMDKETDKSAVNLMKKILKKKMLHSSPRSSNAASGTVDSASAEKKVHKILHMFHRKVHPETSTSSKKSDKPQKNENKKNINNGGHNHSGQMLPDDEYITVIPPRVLSKRSMRRYMSQSNPPQFTLNSSDSDGSRECWIKTDADYLVLEL
ncbi:protein LAZY 1 [Euphorbia lathyris]|uniref:protein LAZY 1 n=1 Tax=Euphorbia lathyris TaxID=212925 RepID=UPI0033137A56